MSEMTPKEAARNLAEAHIEIVALKKAATAAGDALDAVAGDIVQKKLDEVLVGAGESGRITADGDVSPARLVVIIACAAANYSPKELREIAKAKRVSTKSAGIFLPAGRFEHLSRGRGWCRKGSGQSAEFAKRVDGKYLADSEGRWIVGSNDGFSRKDQIEWDVKKVGECWVAE